MDIRVSQKEAMMQPSGMVDVITNGINDFFLKEKDEYTREALVLDLPLTADALDISGNGNDGTAADIIYSDKPDLKMSLPLVSDALDDSDFGNDGTATDIDWTGGVANFNGVSSKIDLLSYAMPTDEFSISFKISLSGAQSGKAIFYTKKIGGYCPFAVIAIDNSVIIYTSPSTGGYHYNAINGLSHNTIYNITVIYDGSTIKTYLNNTYVNQTNIIINTTLPGASFGYEYEEFINYFPGTLSNFRLINHALTDAERTRLYTENVYLPLPQPVACFNGTSSKIAANYSPLVSDDFSISVKLSVSSSYSWQSSYINIIGNHYFTPNNTPVIGLYTDQTNNKIIGIIRSLDNSSLVETPSFTIIRDVEYAIFLEYDSLNKTVSLYVNNVLIGTSGSATITGYANFKSLILGGAYISGGDDPSGGIIGTISNFRLFNVALTDVERTRLYNENVYLPVFKQKWIEDIDVIDDFLEEEKDRVVFAVIRQRGQDPMSPYEGIQWSESMMSEIPVPLLMQQIMDAAVKESQYVNVNFETIMVGGHEQLSIRFNTVGIDRLYKEIQNV